MTPLPDFSARSPLLEMMDKNTASFAEFDECLRHIEMVNSWTGGYRPVLFWLEKMLPRLPRAAPITIADIGCGRGETLRKIWRWAQKRSLEVRLTGIDLNPSAKISAEKATPAAMNIHYETQDIFSVGLPQYDIIVSSHLLHHLDAKDQERFIHWMEDHAKLAWACNDLRRHALPYLFIKNLLSLIPINEMARNDGPLSVARASTLAELEDLLDKTDIPAGQCTVKRFFPFRLSALRLKQGILA